MTRVMVSGFFAALAAMVLPATGLADESNAPRPADAADAAPPSAHAGDIWQRDALTGDWGGDRSALEDSGILLGVDSIDEVLAAVAGGTGSGAIYEGRIEALATLNLDKLIGWTGATFHVNAYQTDGRGLSSNYLGNNLLTASNIEAGRSTRLFDLWIEQVLLDGKLSVRLGQIAADDEFFTSLYAANFINATFGWPAILGTDLPAGGPAYPLATPGIRVNVVANDELVFSFAALDGDPAGPGPGDGQLRDANGTSFEFGGAALLLSEAGYAIDQDKTAAGMPTTYKLGIWCHTGRFADQRLAPDGASLAAPSSNGMPALHNGNYGAYAVIDRAVWQDPNVDDRNIGVFLRLAGAPDDRNEISLYGDAGVVFKAPFADRTSDVFGIGLAVAMISPKARGLDADARRLSGQNLPIRDSESVLEATYRYQVTPWWALQPDFQFIRHPGGEVRLPTDPTRPMPNATVIGLRSDILL